MIEILSTGAPNTVQDGGRFGFLSSGVSPCGAMDRPALEAANLLVGNAADAAGIEVALFPFRLRFEADTRFAVAGAPAPAALDGVALPPWWTGVAAAGQVLRLDPPARGARICLAFAGGIDVPVVLGSRATDAKGGFGGHEGRGLRRGDRLALGRPAGRPGRGGEFAVVPPWTDGEEGAVRVLPAAEWPLFAEESRELFLASEWTVSAEANRMGYRFEGPRLALSRPVELFSHGIVPGTVQVPAAGQPIVQMADANTHGGYPKIVTVIEADLWRLAQAPVGATVRFALVERDAAVRAWRALREGIAAVGRAADLAAGR